MESIFGEAFNIETKKPKTKDLVDKISNPEEAEVDIDKMLKSKKLSIEDRLALINENVLTILGKQRANVIVIRDKQTFQDYITNAINSGRIAIDTETNNSLDPYTCQIMGPCFYYPGGKQAYVPVHHVDYRTGETLPNQLTEEDIKEQLQRIVSYRKQCQNQIDKLKSNFDNGIYPLDFEGQEFNNWLEYHAEEYQIKRMLIIMHNGKFDYEVLKRTCGIEVIPDWDTLIAYRLLDENEKAGLKDLYVKNIDPSQTKYSIEKFFKNIPYAFVDPAIFALYAATDSLMTDKVYLWEKPKFFGKDMKKLYWLFKHVEMPIVVVTAEMELKGIKVDKELAQRLKEKYEAELIEIDNKINKILESIQELIMEWKLSPEANAQTRQYQPEKSKKSLAEIEALYPLYDEEENKRYKIGKPRILQITDPINLSSPVQLAILFFDILGAPAISKKKPRGTGSETLKAFKERFSNYQLEQKIEDEIEEEDQTEDDEDNENKEEKADDILTLDDLDDDELKNDKESKTEIKKKTAVVELSKLILARRGITKIITTYVDVIPKLVSHWPDGRIRFKLNSMGTDTGRYSSGGKIKFFENGESITIGGINIQNIPSHNKEIRMLFVGDTIYNEKTENTDGYFEVNEYEEVETTDGWKYPKDLFVGEYLITDEGNKQVLNIKVDGIKYYILVKE